MTRSFPWPFENRQQIKAIQHPSDQSAFKSVLMSAGKLETESLTFGSNSSSRVVLVHIHPSVHSFFLVRICVNNAAPHFMWKWWHFIITSREDLPEISEVFPTFPALPNPPDAVYVKRVNMNVCDIEHNWLVGHIPQRDRFVCEAVCSSSMATHS